MHALFLNLPLKIAAKLIARLGRGVALGVASGYVRGKKFFSHVPVSFVQSFLVVFTAQIDTVASQVG